MSKYIFLIFILLTSGAFAEDRTFKQVRSDTKQLLCPCEFNESVNGAREGSYGSGEMVLIIAPNESRPFALINLGGEDIKLDAVGSPRYQCKKGEVYLPSWKTDGMLLTAKLKVVSPGEEACWFDGTITLEVDKKPSTIRVKGACGC